MQRAERTQGICINRSGADVRDYYPASGFKHAKAFDDRAFAISIPSDVVNSKA